MYTTRQTLNDGLLCYIHVVAAAAAADDDEVNVANE
jgi:hypothetical protein